jgi:hypothetical protein
VGPCGSMWVHVGSIWVHVGSMGVHGGPCGVHVGPCGVHVQWILKSHGNIECRHEIQGRLASMVEAGGDGGGQHNSNQQVITDRAGCYCCC